MPHYIEPVIYGSGMSASIIPFFFCNEPDTASCRQWCKNGCEEHPRVNDLGEEVPCETSALGYCYQVNHMNDSDPSLWLELYVGSPNTQIISDDEDEITSPVYRQVMGPGEVELLFDGDGYRWRYAINRWEWGYTYKNANTVWTTSNKEEAEAIVHSDNEQEETLKFYLVSRQPAGKWVKYIPE